MKWFAVFLLMLPAAALAASGQTGASFLDIPVGARAAALGSAYTALADDAYAPVWNPAGLGFVSVPQAAGQHLAYLGTIHHEYFGAAYPFAQGGRAIGGSLQYLGSGDMAALDPAGNSLGTFSSSFASYNIAYGQRVGEHVSLGATGKWIHAALSDARANAGAMDVGGLWKTASPWRWAATITNVGTKLKFIDQADPLPLAFHLGGAYETPGHHLAAMEVVCPKSGSAGVRGGWEWNPLPQVALRTGYRTDTIKELSALSGLSLGVGLRFWGQEFSYAWRPLGALGDTQYFSLLVRFGEPTETRPPSRIKAAQRRGSNARQRPEESEFETLQKLLEDTDR